MNRSISSLEQLRKSIERAAAQTEAVATASAAAITELAELSVSHQQMENAIQAAILASWTASY